MFMCGDFIIYLLSKSLDIVLYTMFYRVPSPDVSNMVIKERGGKIGPVFIKITH